MISSPLITVVTPSYNRAAYLQRLYESLKAQQTSDFIWMIVDDGSTDDTRKVVDGFKADNPLFALEYYYKPNGGKHTALNLAIDKATTPLFFIVDSDDMLTPDAITTIEDDWRTIDTTDSTGISYLRGYDTERQIGDIFPKDHDIDTFNNVRIWHHVNGDKAEVWATEHLKKLRFPVFEGERFIGENWMWTQMSDMAPMLFVNKIIYISEYIEGGLTRSGRKMRIGCPHGGMTNSLVMMDVKFPLRYRVKNTLLYVAYGFFARLSVSQIIHCKYSLLTAICLFPGYMLYKFWEKKYLKN